jgi:hypothetical protein
MNRFANGYSAKLFIATENERIVATEVYFGHGVKPSSTEQYRSYSEE